MRIYKILIYLTAFFLSLLLLLATWAGWRQTNLSSKLIRLHVVANSDTEADQALKLRVRDAVLEQCAPLLSGSKSTEEAVAVLSGSLSGLAQAGAQTVQREGYRYPVRVRLEYADFPKTDYEDFSLPAGRYRALRVEIGSAEGHNWWCVVFPALCMGSVTEVSETAMSAGLTGEDVSLITQSGEDYVIRFRCVELWEELLQRLNGTGSASCTASDTK